MLLNVWLRKALLRKQEGMRRQRRSWGSQLRTIVCERLPRRFAPPLLYQEGSRFVIGLTLALLAMTVGNAHAASRIKDIGHFAGVRSNPLIGYGLVIGLNKTGDKRQTFFT